MEPFRLNTPNFSKRHISMNWNFNRWLVVVGWRFRFAVGAPLLSPAVSSRNYGTLLGFLPGKRSASLILVAAHGRFGNSIRNVAYALAVAKRLGVEEVVAKSLPQFPFGSWSVSEGLTLTHNPALRPRFVKNPKTVLGGDFFLRARLPVDIDGFDFSTIGKSLRHVLSTPNRGLLPEDTLVIHLRSGDAFREKPNAGLAQPPLSFYVEAISHTRPSLVTIVFESDENPVIGALQDWLRTRGIPFQTQSSDFSADLSTLLSAQSLVLARGTLGSALLLLSSNLKTIVVFDKQDLGVFPKAEAPRVLRVADKAGDYARTVIGSWTNSAFQREQMLEYPQTNLHSTWVEPANPRSAPA